MREFFDFLRQPPLLAAPSLLGCILVHGEARVRLVEVEAYGGSEDLGSHAARGVTPRNQVMFGPAGVSYVYLNYGMYWLMNVVCHTEGQPGAILLRAAEPLAGFGDDSHPQLLAGPGRLGRALGLGRPHYGIDLLDPNSLLRLEPGEPCGEVLATPRIGLAAGKGDELPWRFIDRSRERFASRRPAKG